MDTRTKAKLQKLLNRLNGNTGYQIEEALRSLEQPEANTMGELRDLAQEILAAKPFA